MIRLWITFLICSAFACFAFSQVPKYPCVANDCPAPGENKGWIVGEIRAFAFGAESKDLIKKLALSGWVECAGQTANRKKFSKLWAVIGDTWGSGDGSTDFYLPDLRGMFLRGWNHSGSSGQAPRYGGDPNAPDRQTPRPEIASPGTKGHDKDQVGSAQQHQAQVMPHTHGYVGHNRTLERASAPSEPFLAEPTGRTTSDPQGIATNYETRPNNFYVMYMIYVGRGATVKESTSPTSTGMVEPDSQEGTPNP